MRTQQVYSLAWAATAHSHRLDGLDDRNVFSHSFGGQKSQVTLLAGLVSSEASLWFADGLNFPGGFSSVHESLVSNVKISSD